MTLEEYVKNHLEDMASKDANFRERFEDEEKSMKECLQYIMEQAKERAKNGSCVAIADEDVANWAVHYYQEKDCKPKGNVQAKVVAPPSEPTKQAATTVTMPKSKAKKLTETQQKAMELDLFGGM